MMVDTSGLPQPNEAFAWVQAPGGPALVCRPLAEVAPHVFTTRRWQLGARAPENDGLAWAEVAGSLDLEPSSLVRARQVHGVSVLVGDGTYTASALSDADIIVTDRFGLGLAVQAADCVPLLVADRRTGAVAAAHAGWRGMAAGVPGEVVATLARRFGSRPRDLVAALGPSVGACCYEVGVDVRRRFEASAFPADRVARWFHDQPTNLARNPTMSGVARTGRADHWFFDGWAATTDALVEAGVGRDQVFLAELCTASHPDVLCSYRRDGAPAGRLAAAIRRAPPRP
jgi:YfiH family protein